MGLLDFTQAASNAIAGNVSGPVDLLNWLLSKGGMGSKEPIGGSEWMKRLGLTREVEPGWAGVLGETAGALSPLAGSPGVARALVKAQANAAIPRTLNPQTGAIVPMSTAKTWFRGQHGPTAADHPFDASVKKAPSFTDSPEVASAYAMNPDAASLYGWRGAQEGAGAGANVARYRSQGKVLDLSKYQGGFGTETGITPASLKKLAKELNLSRDEMSVLDIGWSQKYGRGPNQYWDAAEGRSNARNRIVPAWVIAEDPTIIEAAKRMGIDSIQLKGAMSSNKSSTGPWSEELVNTELRPLHRDAILDFLGSDPLTILERNGLPTLGLTR